MENYSTQRLDFTPDAAEPDKWWAIDQDNVEYCIHHPLPLAGADPDAWTCFAQRRVGFDSTSVALGTYWDFEEAAEACDAFDPAEAGLLDCVRHVSF